MEQRGKAVDGVLPSGIEVVKIVRKHQENALLSFSLGKDSIATWVAIHGKFKRIVPYYLYTVPGLSFIEDALKYYEHKFGERIYRYPHPNFYRMLDNGVFQHPLTTPVTDAAELPSYNFMDINVMCAEDAGIPLDTMSCTGVRAADSPIRRVAFTKHGVISWNKGIFYPVWDWTKQDVMDALITNKVNLPIDYKVFGRSYDGIDLRFLLPIREHFPDDFKKIVAWFPMVECEIVRYEAALRKGYIDKRRKRA